MKDKPIHTHPSVTSKNNWKRCAQWKTPTNNGTEMNNEWNECDESNRILFLRLYQWVSDCWMSRYRPCTNRLLFGIMRKFCKWLAMVNEIEVNGANHLELSLHTSFRIRFAFDSNSILHSIWEIKCFWTSVNMKYLCNQLSCNRLDYVIQSSIEYRR